MATLTPLDNYNPSQESSAAPAISGNLTPLPNDYNPSDDSGGHASSRMQNLKSDISGNMNPLAAGIAGTGEIVGAGTDYANKVLGDVVPGYKTATEAIGNATKGAVSKVADFEHPAAQWVADKIDSPIAEDTAQVFGDFSKNHPDYMASVKGGANIMGGLGLTEGATNLGKSLGEASAINSDKMVAKAAAAPDYTLRTYEGNKPVAASLAKNTNDAYDKAHDLGLAFTPDASQAASDKLSSDLGKLNDKLHSKTLGALDLFQDDAKSGLDLQKLEDNRKVFSKIAYGSSDANDAGAAKKAIGSIDQIYNHALNDPSVLAGGTPEAVSALQEARADHALEQNHAQISSIVRQANGNASKLQSGFKSLYDNEDTFNRFAPEDQQMIASLAHPSGLNRVLESAGKAGFAGNGKYLPLGEAAATLYNPLAAIPLAGGTAANLVRNSMVRGMTEKLLQSIENKSVPAGTSDLFKGLQQQADSAGEMQESRPPTLSQEYDEATKPVLGNTEFPKDINMPMTSQLSPQERMQAAGNVYQRIVNKPTTPTLDARNSAIQSTTNGSAGKQLKNIIGNNNPISSLQDIAPSTLSDSLAREAEQERIAEERRIRGSYKRGGTIPTPAQIREINKKAGRTRQGRKVA